MPTVTSRLLPLAVAAMLATLGAPVSAQSNTNTTIQEGKININHTFQCGDSNDNATYQSGKININHTLQRCGNNRNQTAQFGRVNHNKTDQDRGLKHGRSRLGGYGLSNLRRGDTNHGRSRR